MHVRARLFSLSLGLFACPLFAHAQATAPVTAPVAEPATAARTVTLRQVLQQARTNPPSILAALATLKRIEATESYARGAYIPRVTIEGGAGINFNDQPYLTADQQKYREALARITPEQIAMLPEDQQEATRAAIANQLAFPARFRSTSRSFNGRATFDYALFDLSRRYAVKSAELNTEAQTSAYAEAQRAAEQAATELYMRAIAAEALLEDARLTLERRESQLQAISGLTKAGLRPSVDATRAEIEAVAARYALETREIELAASAAALAAAMGDDPEHGARPAGFDDASLPAPLPPLKAAAVAIERRPEIRQLELALASRRNDHSAAIGARLPTAGLLATGDISHQDIISGNGYQGRFVSAAASAYVRWAALDPAVWRRANVTSRAITEAQRQLETALLSVRAQVVEAAYNVQRARAVVDQTQQIWAAASAARTAQNERYRAGVASLLDLLDAEGIEQNARRSRIEAERDHRIARVRLLALCGETDKLER